MLYPMDHSSFFIHSAWGVIKGKNKAHLPRNHMDNQRFFPILNSFTRLCHSLLGRPLRRKLDELITPEQTAHLPARRMQDNILQMISVAHAGVCG